MQYIEGGVTAAKGFMASSAAAGIKYEGRQDMALVYSSQPCICAGTFTKNIVQAAPVKWDKRVVREFGKAQAIVCNSGIANACTGVQGYQYCKESAEAVGAALGIDENLVLTASTGVIGMQLKIDRVKAGIAMLASSLKESLDAGHAAARAIMTTDTVPKEAAVSFDIGGRSIVIGGMCKGSGMIHPNMCTMLCFITTDAAISGEMLQKALSEDIEETFNMVSVDGDTSTNDTVLLLANGEAGNEEIAAEGEAFDTFKAALHLVNQALCKKIAGDGEGATALFEMRVIGADDAAQAKILAKSVVSSNLVKAAICGHDANWGRILCAMGYSGAEFDPEKVDLFFESRAGRIQIMKDGTGTDFDEEEATRILSEPEVTAQADLKSGSAEATAWGCDLTKEYVAINGDYRS